MKLRAFLNNKKHSMRNQIWVIAVFMVLFFLAFPVFHLLLIQGLENSNDLNGCTINLTFQNLAISGMVIALLAGLISAIHGYFYLYSRSKVDLYHSLPVKRSTFFKEKAIQAVEYYLISYIPMLLVTMLLGIIEGHYTKVCWSIAIKMLLVHFLIYLFMYFSSVLVLAMTGNFLMGILSLFGLYAYGPLLGLMISFLKNEFYRTSYWGNRNFLETWASPVITGVRLIENFDQSLGMEIVGVAVATAVFGVLAYVAYVKRPSEGTGKSLVYSWSRWPISFMVNILAGFATGIIFYTTGNSVGWGIFGIIFGIIVVHSVVQIILYMNFRSFVKERMILASSVLVVTAVMAVMKYDLTGYDTYLPKIENIEQIYITGEGSWYKNRNDIWVSENGTMKTFSHYSDEYIQYCEAGVSQELYDEIHSLIDQQKKGIEYRYDRICVMYKLKSGKEIYRRYEAKAEQSEHILKCIYDNGKQKDLIYGCVENLNGDEIKGIRLTYQNELTKMLFENDGEKRKSLVQALCQDIKEASSEVLTGIPCGVLDIEYSAIDDRNSSEYSLHTEIRIYPEYERTMRILKDAAGEVLDEEIIKESVTITYFPGENQKESITYTEPEQIRQWNACVISENVAGHSNKWREWMETTEIWISEIDGKLDTENDYCIVEEKLPDFVLRDLEKLKEIK